MNPAKRKKMYRLELLKKLQQPTQEAKQQPVVKPAEAAAPVVKTPEKKEEPKLALQELKIEQPSAPVETVAVVEEAKQEVAPSAVTETAPQPVESTQQTVFTDTKKKKK